MRAAHTTLMHPAPSAGMRLRLGKPRVLAKPAWRCSDPRPPSAQPYATRQEPGGIIWTCRCCAPLVAFWVGGIHL